MGTSIPYLKFLPPALHFILAVKRILKTISPNNNFMTLLRTAIILPNLFPCKNQNNFLKFYQFLIQIFVCLDSKFNLKIKHICSLLFINLYDI